jgi:SAM-dependent methyltransferase
MGRGNRRFDLLREATEPQVKRPDERRARTAEAPPEALAAGAVASGGTAPPAVPDYLRDCYTWAYLNRRMLTLLDRPLVVTAILWGTYSRLLRSVLAELRPGQRVLQPACVYGDFSPSIARFLGSHGRLDVSDVVPLQVENCRRKLKAYPQASLRIRDAATLGSGSFDAVCCFFLLHEMPEPYKRAVVDALLSSVRPGGKVIFVDYHKPHWAHPLKPVMSLVFDTLEPFAKDLWRRDIAGYARAGDQFAWSKETYFGGLYQKVVARRWPDPPDPEDL